MTFPFVLIIYLFTISSFSAEVKITAHPDYPPISWESGGTLKGASIRLVETALGKLGYKAVFVPVGTWGRAQLEVKLGRIDILLPPYKNPEREKHYIYPSEPFLMDKTVIFTKKGKVINYEKFQDLKKYEGIAIQNDSFGLEFDKADKKFQILKRFSKTKQCLEFLLRGRADYFIGGENAVLSVISKLGLEGKFDIQEKVIVEAGMYSVISKESIYNNKKFRDSFFSEMKKLISEKSHEREIENALKEYKGEKLSELWH